MGVFVAGVPSSLALRTPFFSRVLAPLPLSRLRLLRRLSCQGHDGKRPQLSVQYQLGPVPLLAVNFP